MLIMLDIVQPSHANCGFAGRGLVMRAASVLVVPMFRVGIVGTASV